MGSIAARSFGTIPCTAFYAGAMPTKPPPEGFALHLQKAQADHIAGRLDEAAESYAAVLMQDGRNLPAHLGMGILSLQKGEACEAETQLRRALRLNPRAATVHLHLAAAMRIQDRASEALMHVQFHESLRPGSPEGALELALIQVALGEDEIALAVAVQWAEAHPKAPEGGLNLGRVYQALGRLGEARACFEVVLTQNPDHQEALGLQVSTLVGLGAFTETFRALLTYEAASPGDPSTGDLLAQVVVLLAGEAERATEPMIQALTRGRVDAARSATAGWVSDLSKAAEVWTALVAEAPAKPH